MNIDYNKICLMYNNGYDVSIIADECHCSTGTIYNTLKKHKINHRNHRRGILQETRDKVIDSYCNNKSVYSICNSFKLSQNKVKRILNEANINEISASKRLNPDLDENYFENIDTPEKAYWTGWLITDGCVSKKHSIGLSLQMKDKYILELFEKDIGLHNKIKIFNKRYFRFSFCCKKMIEDLSKYGIIENKTFTVDIPNIKKELISSLLRGCFEGDGGISKSFRKKYKRYEYELSFCGNYNCVSSFNKIISREIDMPPKNIVKSNSIFRVRWSSRSEIIKIMEYLYRDCGEHKLSRKYDYIKELKAIK